MDNLSLQDVWERVLKRIQSGISQQSFDMWLKPTTLVSVESNKVTVLVPNHFFMEWIEEHYGELLCEYLKEELSSETVVLNFSIQRTDETHAKNVYPQGEKKIKNNILSSKYTFERFVVGSSNQFAYAAAMKVAEQPGKSYNPLFLYGGVGLGKTHLLCAVGNYILSDNPNCHFSYLPAEQFTNEVIHGIRHKTIHDMKRKYRNMDVLLIDDIQFLSKKEMTQEEFFHTFNALYELNKQIVISSDRPVKEILDIDERLRSRFEMGLVADIQPPDLETRIVILKQKAEVEKIKLLNEVALYLATHIKTNVRELEGALIRVGAFSELTRQEITLDLVRKVLKDTIAVKKTTITIEDTLQKVSERFQIKIADIKSKRRTKNLIYPRQIAMYLARELTHMSFPEIGRHFGDKDHTTIMYACKQIEKELESNFNLRTTIESLTQGLKEG